MRADGKWLSASCGTQYPFVCQEDEGSSGMYVVLEKKSWIEAQTYCRLKNGELASVMNQTENEALQQVLDENGPLSSSVWIGLFRDAWEWSDHSDNSFRYWHSSQPNNDGICTVYHISYDSWFDRDCASSRPFYCYNVKVTRLIVRMEMKSSAFFKFSESALSQAIFNQIQKKYDGVTLQWRVQPDGTIFHKKEESQ
ncbi:C-type lectin lectoxin-Enh4-like [Chelmon rostratus]|uniref:C-type lectin lectoxin-Enh4-like n=1 Tax=Chelmon rostratus TaxID=109905 RepID=UPI001BEBD6AD|nr:C-type lectin lectoxin-Enh4-like [Chelmon rostratus]